jgi:hypothetical protein
MVVVVVLLLLVLPLTCVMVLLLLLFEFPLACIPESFVVFVVSFTCVTGGAWVTGGVTGVVGLATGVPGLLTRSLFFNPISLFTGGLLTGGVVFGCCAGAGLGCSTGTVLGFSVTTTTGCCGAGGVTGASLTTSLFTTITLGGVEYEVCDDRQLTTSIMTAVNPAEERVENVVFIVKGLVRKSR